MGKRLLSAQDRGSKALAAASVNAGGRIARAEYLAGLRDAGERAATCCVCEDPDGRAAGNAANPGRAAPRFPSRNGAQWLGARHPQGPTTPRGTAPK